MKKCPKCLIDKEIKEFSNHKANKDGLRSYCKSCANDMAKEYQLTLDGVITTMYSSQIRNSKTRGHVRPNYTKEEIKYWCLIQPLFCELFYCWKNNDYATNLKPSIDRINDDLPYTFTNIQLMTWGENKQKYKNQVINGENTKQCKSVIKYSLFGEKIDEYYSLTDAERKTNINRGDIRRVCKGTRNHAGGFKWKYKNE